MQKLEGFQYTTSLDINMGYFTIRLSPASQDTTKIVTEFGKFIYICLPMGLCSLGDIFQSKVDELLGDIEGVKTYIYDIIVLIKDSFENHIDQLIIILWRLRTAGLKVNAPKCSFGLNKIPYLGCVITREGIKPDPKKVQGIMDLRQTPTTTEARGLIGMVQYCRDMWLIRSHILATMTEAANGPKYRKLLWNDALEISFKEPKRVVSAETLLSYTYWEMTFTVHTYASDK